MSSDRPILTHIGKHKRILFVLPPCDLFPKPVNPSHHPIMTATLAGVAIDLGFTVGALDATLNGLNPKQTAQHIAQWRPDWVWFIPYEYRRELPLLTTQATLRFLEPLFKTCVGLANCPREEKDLKTLFENGDVDAVIYDDSETTLAKILCDQPQDADGMCFRTSSGEIIKSERHPTIDWASLPVPAWKIFEHQRYYPSAHRYKNKPILPIMASRSCPYGCDFCPQSLFNPSQKHATRPVEALIQEVETLIEDYGVVELEFYDPTFGIKRDETVALCRKLAHLPVTWSCYTRCDLMDDALLREMAAAGCHTILFGVESGNEQILERTQKELSHADVLRTVKICRNLGIQTIASFILGLPGETAETLRESIAFSLRLNPTYAQYHLLRSFFEHDSWAEVGHIERNWNVSSASVNGYAYIPKDLTTRALQLGMLRAYGAFYLRPSKVKELLSDLKTPADWKRIGLGIKQVSQHLKQL